LTSPPTIAANTVSSTSAIGYDTNTTRSAATRRDARPPTKSLMP
jgi:hypothetical protein